MSRDGGGKEGKFAEGLVGKSNSLVRNSMFANPTSLGMNDPPSLRMEGNVTKQEGPRGRTRGGKDFEKGTEDGSVSLKDSPALTVPYHAPHISLTWT